MSISTSWAIGFVVGILLVALLCGVMVKMARRNGGGKGEFDERQLAARGKAYAMGYYTLLLYLLFWMIMRSLETSFFMEPESVLIGALLSLAVFVSSAPPGWSTWLSACCTWSGTSCTAI